MPFPPEPPQNPVEEPRGHNWPAGPETPPTEGTSTAELIDRELARALPFPTPTYTSNDSCIIRPFHVQDIPLLERYANNWNIARWMTDRFPHPYTRTDAECWVSCQPRVLTPFTSIQPRRPTVHPGGGMDVPWDNTINFVIADPQTNELIGSIGVKPGSDVLNRSADLGYWLAEPHWGKGIMSSAVNAFIRKIFFRTMGLRKLTAHVYVRRTRHGMEGNHASRKVLANAGFRVEGTLRSAVYKKGEWWDQEVWGILREEVLGEESSMPNGVHRGAVYP